jgi:hypothetical protein
MRLSILHTVRRASAGGSASWLVKRSCGPPEKRTKRGDTCLWAMWLPCNAPEACVLLLSERANAELLTGK